MQVFILSKTGQKTISFPFSGKRAAVLVGVVFCSILSMGYYLGHTNTNELPVAQVERMQQLLAEQDVALQQVQVRSENTFDGLALRLGQLQSQMLRLNAVGQQLAKRAKLDPAEFNFEESPAVGGANADVLSESMGEDELRIEIARLQQDMALRAQQLKMLDNILLNKDVGLASKPAGRPIEKGWLSSKYGYRTDPFTGRRAFHHGIDFAGKAGSDVVSVASGLVTWVGARDGYGQLVEIDHGNGFVTRYGHNATVLVKAGDVVKPSQVIAKMGSTGRSTGPHVHFEVIKQGKSVNPAAYINKTRSPVS